MVAQNRREALARQLRGEDPYLPGTPSSSVSGARAGTGPLSGGSDTSSRLNEAKARLEELQLRYTDRHPEVIALRETILQLEDRLKQEVAALQRGDAAAASLAGAAANPVYQSIQLQLNQADVEIAALRGQIADGERVIGDLSRLKDLAPEVEAEFARLNRDYGVTKGQYEALVQRLETARISDQATETGTLRFEVIDPPTARFEPVDPNRPLLGTAVLLAGLVTGVAVAWLMHQLRPVFSNARRLSDFTGLPILGVVSRAGEARFAAEDRQRLMWFSAGAAGLVVMYGLAMVQGFSIAGLLRAIGVGA
jgi:polysaccharide chain length determinant protein (PEP-CTERM system associated)